jgi:hypothetical protein
MDHLKAGGKKVDYKSLWRDERVYAHPWALCQDAADEEARRRLVFDAFLSKSPGRPNGPLYNLFVNFHRKLKSAAVQFLLCCTAATLNGLLFSRCSEFFTF